MNRELVKVFRCEGDVLLGSGVGENLKQSVRNTCR